MKNQDKPTSANPLDEEAADTVNVSDNINALDEEAAAPVNVSDNINALSSAISELDAEYTENPKAFYNNRDGNERAKALRDALSALVARTHKFITA